MAAYYDYLRKTAMKAMTEHFRESEQVAVNPFSQGAINKFLHYKASKEVDASERIMLAGNNKKEPNICFKWTDEEKNDIQIGGLNKIDCGTQKPISSKSILNFLRNKEINPRKREIVLITAKLFNALSKYDFKKQEKEIIEQSKITVPNETIASYPREDWRFWVSAAEKITEPRIKIDLYLNALAEIPNDVQIIKNIGVAFYETGRYEEAEKYYLKGIGIAPNDADIHSNYGLLLHEIRQDIKAEEYFKKAVELAPRHKHANAHYAYFLHEMKKDFREAEKYYRIALKINPDNLIALGNYGWLLCFEKFNPLKGLPMLEKGLQLLPNNVTYMGVIAFVNSTYELDLNLAEQLFRKAIELAPASYIKHGNFSQLLFAIGKRNEALEHLTISQKYAGANLEFLLELEYYRYAHCFERMDEAEQKIKTFLNNGITSELKNFSITVKAAIREGHPNITLLIKYAQQITKMNYSKDGQMVIPKRANQIK